MDDTQLGITGAERWLAAALAGDGEALEALARHDASGELARRHRAGAALYLRAQGRGLQAAATSVWHRDLLGGTAHYLRLQTAVDEIAHRLAGESVDWLPFKGCDVARRFYDTPEERPTADIDLLIGPAHLDRARRSLEEDGWQALYPGPLNQKFLMEEGYAWMAHKKARPLLELHFRLWGLVPEGFSEWVLDRSQCEPSPFPGERRARATDAYLIAAVHEWLAPPPRYLVAWWDLARISERLSPTQVDEVVEGAQAWDLQLPVSLAAEVSSALWGQPGCREIARRLAAELRLPERRLAAGARRHGLVRCPLPGLQAARLLSGRRSRQGWRGAWRRLWAHAGIVERATPEHWSWIRRRVVYQVRRLRP